MSAIDPTKRLLRIWGRWAGGGIIGFPRMSAFMRIQMGAPSTMAGHVSPDILHCDKVIARSDLAIRRVIITHFCGNGTVREKAIRMGCPKTTYLRRVDDAIWYVHTEMEKPSIEAVYQVA